MEVLHALSDWVVAWADSPFGWLALALIATAESVIFPVPPDPLLLGLAVATPEWALWYAFLATATSVLGGLLGHTLGLWFGRPLLYRMFKESKIRFVERAYDRWGVWAVTVAGLTPIPYKVFTVSAGAFDLDRKRFVVASVIGRGARFFSIGVLVMLFGTQIQDFVNEYFDILSVAFVALLVGGFAAVALLSRRFGGADVVEEGEAEPPERAGQRSGAAADD